MFDFKIHAKKAEMQKKVKMQKKSRKAKNDAKKVGLMQKKNVLKTIKNCSLKMM